MTSYMETIKKFKLQNIILRSESLPDEHFAMMYRVSKLRYEPMTSSFALNNGEFIEFFTYFNSLSYGKWKKYTNVGQIHLSLKVKGSFSIQLFGHYRHDGEIKKEFYPLYNYSLDTFTDIDIPVPENIQGTVIGFQIISFRDFSIQCGQWYADVKKSDIRDVRISIATTTFKKESYIKRNVDLIERELFYSGEPCGEHFRLRIVDNGRTLDPADFNSKYVTLYPNINAGGAGGFTRGMIESIHSDQNPTHILLMDDDVTIMPESFIRTYSLLALIKDEYKEYFISGAMLRNQQMNEQHEDVGYVVDEGYYRPAKPTMFLHLWDEVFKNDEFRPQRPNSYAAWWYCCFPVTQLHENDLPLPIFIRCDDVDFSIRHNAQILTLNGIFVWHDDFKYKFNASMEFYMVTRNSLITQAIDGIYQNADFIGHIDNLFKERLKSISYTDCDLLLDAIEDYLKGPEFIMSPNGEQIVKEKSAKNEKLADLRSNYSDAELAQLSEDLYSDVPLTKFQKFMYSITFNYHIFPKCFLNKETKPIPYDWFYAPGKNYMRSQLLAVNPSNGTGNLRIRSRKRCLKLLIRRNKLLKRYKREGQELARRYHDAGNVFRSEEFWRKYLGI